MPSAGYVYVLINYSMANLVKVGKTSRDTESRARELSSVTGVPTPFIVAFESYFQDCDQAEIYIHEKLEQFGYRISENREFFQAPLKEVIALIIEAQQLLQSTHLASSNIGPSNDAIEDTITGEPWSEIEALAAYYYNLSNYKEAYNLYNKALAMGSPTCHLWMGRMTLNGQGCIEDEQEAIQFYEAGAQAQDEKCYAELAHYHFYTTRDFDAAIGFVEKYLESDKPLNPTTIFMLFIPFGLRNKVELLINMIKKYRLILLDMSNILCKRLLGGWSCQGHSSIKQYCKLIQG